jgi:hypothetical protein
MRTCLACGQTNLDSATRCVACGKELTANDPGARKWKRVAVLNSEVEAERLDVELENLKIPHVLVTYSDSALDGLYQVARGWGHVEAEAQHEGTIRSLLEDVRGGKLEETPEGK